MGRTLRAGPPDRLAHARPRARSFTADLAAMEARLRDCALSHAVDAAVAARTPAISAARQRPRARRPRHGRHAHRPGRRTAGSATPQEPQWLAPPYRWALVLDSLRARHRPRSRRRAAPPHRRLGSAYGRRSPATPAPASSTPSSAGTTPTSATSQRLRAVSYGTRPATAIEQAVGARATDPDWTQRLADALAAFRDCRWPRTTCAPPPPGHNPWALTAPAVKRWTMT